jgi:hypothetical protein
MAYGDGVYVMAATSTNPIVMVSPDGANWQTFPSALGRQWNAMAFGNGRFVAVAAFGAATPDRIMISPPA